MFLFTDPVVYGVELPLMRAEKRNGEVPMGDTAHVEKVWDFLELGQKKLDTLSVAIESGDTVAVRSCTQDLRIRAAGLGLGEVAKYAEAVESGAYNCCLTHTLTSYNRLRTRLEGLKKELAQAPETD